MTLDEKHAVLDIAIEMAWEATRTAGEVSEWLRAHAHALRDIAITK